MLLNHADVRVTLKFSHFLQRPIGLLHSGRHRMPRRVRRDLFRIKAGGADRRSEKLADVRCDPLARDFKHISGALVPLLKLFQDGTDALGSAWSALSDASW